MRLTTATAWLGKPRGKPLSIDTLVLRYLAAFGPASAADVRMWSGLARLGEVLERLDLTQVKTEGGQTLYDIPNAPCPGPDVRAPVRLVAPFDNILLSQADRTRVISDEHRKRLFSGKGEATSMRVQPYIRLKRGVGGEIEVEGNRLLERAFGLTEPRVEIAL